MGEPVEGYTNFLWTWFMALPERLGWSAPGISEAEALKLWNIVEIGLGGYVIGRSAEKTLPRIVEVLRR